MVERTLWTLAIAAAALFLAWAQHARAHDFYDPWCCNDKDCQPIAADSVKVTRQGYVVSLREGQHIGLKPGAGSMSYLIPFKDARPSPDGKFHACIMPWQVEVMRCFYAPVGGV